MQCSPYQVVTGKIYCPKQHFLPPATVWRFTKIKEVLLKNTQVVIQSDSHMPQENESRKVLNYTQLFFLWACTATEMIPTVEMISATELTLDHHRNDTYLQSKWSRHKFLEPWLKWTWDFAIYSKFFVYSCKHDFKQRKIEKAIRLIIVLYTDFIFKISTFF